jgi:RsiW-degrading membrane proteinase PrsW (M82 family)/RNA polymerase subunit RPABC4/transcription elongation factor Spt4
VVRVFLAGCACTIPVGVIEHATGAGLVQDTLFRSGTMSFLLIAPLEELSKLVAVWLAIYRSPNFREPLDGIIYSGTAAMGFASVENIVYLGYLGPGIIVSRALFATPAHVMFSSMWGYSMGLARFRREGEISTITKGLVISALLHGTYNFLVALHPKTAMFSLLPLMIFMGWLMNRRIQDFRRNLPFPSLGKGALIYCPNCGAYTPEEAETCNRCGFQIPVVEMDAPRFCGRCRARLDPGREACPSCGERIFFSEEWRWY